MSGPRALYPRIPGVLPRPVSPLGLRSPLAAVQCEARAHEPVPAAGTGAASLETAAGATNSNWQLSGRPPPGRLASEVLSPTCPAATASLFPAGPSPASTCTRCVTR
jgi:hypothetical protein